MTYTRVMVDTALLEQAKRLGDADKLEIIHALWDSINHEERPASADVLALVRQRAADAEVHPDDEISSAEFWAGVRRRYA